MTLKLLCLNLYEGGLLLSNILEFLEQERPDILALQEVYDGKDKRLPDNLRSIEVLKNQLSDYLFSFAPEAFIKRTEGRFDIGNAIFSKYPIISQEVFFFGIPYSEHAVKPPDGDYSKHPKNMQHCQVKVGGQSLNIFNMHGVWGLDGGDNPARLKMSQIIVNQIRGKQNVILAGDFNVRPHTQTILNIENHLINVFKDETKTTFNLKRKDLKKFPGYANAVVDMVFVSSDIKITDHSMPQVDISDHLPLMISVEM